MDIDWLTTTPPIAAIWTARSLELREGERIRRLGRKQLGGEAPRAIFREGMCLGIITRKALWVLDLARFEDAAPELRGTRLERSRRPILKLWESYDEDAPPALDEAQGIDQALLDSGLFDLESEVIDSELDAPKGQTADPNAPWFIEHHYGALFEIWRLREGVLDRRLRWIERAELSPEVDVRALVRAHEAALYLFYLDPSHGRRGQYDAWRVSLDPPERAEPLDLSRIGSLTLAPRGPFVAVSSSDEPTYAHAPHLHDLLCARVGEVETDADWGPNLRVESSQLEAQAEWELEDPPEGFPRHGASTFLNQTRFSDDGGTLLATFGVSGAPQTLLIDLHAGQVVHMLVHEAMHEEEMVDPHAGLVMRNWGEGTRIYDRHGRHQLPYPVSMLRSTGDGKHWLACTPDQLELWSSAREQVLARWPGTHDLSFASIAPDARALLLVDDQDAIRFETLPQPESETPSSTPASGVSPLILWCLARLARPQNAELELENWLAMVFESEFLAAKLMWEGLDRSARSALADAPPPSGSAGSDQAGTPAQEDAETPLDPELFELCVSLCARGFPESEREDELLSLRDLFGL